MPTLRDEIRFFDEYHDRGLNWYEALFCSREEADRYQAIGEISPQYLECAECPERIRLAIPDAKLIAMLRHPVDRAYSQYGFYVQRRNYRGSFEEFLEAYPRSRERGYYSRYLERYLQYFAREKLLVLVFEDVVSDVSSAKKLLSGFLGITPERFPASAGENKVNPSSVPRHQFLYGLVARSGRQLRRWHLEPVVDYVMRTRLQQVLGKGHPLPKVDSKLKRELSRAYAEEFDALEERFEVDLTRWRE